MNELIELPQYDKEGIRIPDSAVYWWHNTTKAEQDNIRLKMQIDSLIQSNTAIIAINQKLDNSVINIKDVAREVVKEVLNPLSTGKKLTKAEQIKADAAAKTASDNLKLIKKSARSRK